MTEPAPQPSSHPGAGSGGTASGSTAPVAPADRDAPAGSRDANGNGEGQACTQAQLRRFIKSRPYVPMHELRRRFGLNGSDDDVSPVDVDGRRLFIGLPARESGLLGDLLRQGDVGYELLLDPVSPVVVGVFPMRPVQRP